MNHRADRRRLALWVITAIALSSPGVGCTETTRPYRAPTTPRDKTITGVEGLGPAEDATVYSTKGTAVQLASFWTKGKTLLVFYRGDW